MSLTEDLEGSKKVVFKKSRLPGSNFSSKCNIMGLRSARSNSSNRTSVSCDKHSDNSLHALGISNSNAVFPIRDYDELHSLMEPQVASTHDKLAPNASCQMQFDNILQDCNKSNHNNNHNAVSSFRDSDAHHSSVGPQIASAHVGLEHAEAAKKLPPCFKVL